MDFKKLTDTELENITGGGKTKIKITTKEKYYHDDSLISLIRMCTESPTAGAIGGAFLIMLGTFIFGISIHNASRDNNQ